MTDVCWLRLHLSTASGGATASRVARARYDGNERDCLYRLRATLMPSISLGRNPTTQRNDAVGRTHHHEEGQNQ